MITLPLWLLGLCIFAFSLCSAMIGFMYGSLLENLYCPHCGTLLRIGKNTMVFKCSSCLEPIGNWRAWYAK